MNLRLLSGLIWLSLATMGIAQTKPNIIHIMIDDAGVGDFSAYAANSPVSTPNIDRLAANGLKFTRAYNGAVNCAPSRSVLMTGLHGGHAYMRTNGGSASIRDADVTLAEVLRTAGYATAGYGKWGLGAPGSPGAAEQQGFDEWVGFYDQVHAHSHFPDRLYDTGSALLIPENANFAEPETGLVADTRVHQHSIVFHRMQQFVADKAQTETPFYVWGAWTPPHRKSTINQSAAQPGGYYDQYATNAGWDDFDKIQAAFVTWIDDNVGQLEQTLRDPNGDGNESDSVLENTLIVFTSDNGGWENGSHAWDRNRETVGGQDVDLRGSKEGYYEGGLRTPMIAYWPGTVAAGTTTDTPVAFYDYLATFAELAGATNLPPTDGVSFAPTLTGQGVQATREGLYFEGYGYTLHSAPTQVARVGDWKVIRSGGSVQIFDLASDPSETINRVGDPAIAAIQTQLLAYLDRNHTPMTAQLPLDPPNVGTGNAGRDGIVTQAIRPSGEPRNWTVTASGDAKLLTGGVERTGQAVALYLDDLHMDYALDVDVLRTGNAAPPVTVELLGASGFRYYTGYLPTESLTVGTASARTVALDISLVSPDPTLLASDLGQGLTIRFSHAGSSGAISVSKVELRGSPAVRRPTGESR